MEKKQQHEECREGRHLLVSVDEEKFNDLVTYCSREGCKYVEEDQDWF